MGEAILITSGKGGTGKSTVTVNCGAAMAWRGKKVLLIDGDIGLRTLDLMLSVSNKIIYDLADVLCGRCEPIRAIVDTEIPGLSVMPAPYSPGECPLEQGSLRSLCRGLTHYYDYVLIDSPAGIGETMAMLANTADRALVVATADPVSVRDADRVAALLLENSIRDIRLIINMIKPKLIRRKVVYDPDRAIDEAAIQLIGVVPEDENVMLAAYRGVPVVKMGQTRAGTAFDNIARRITGEDLPLMKL